MKKVLEVVVKLKKQRNELVKNVLGNYEFHTKETPRENRVNLTLIKALQKEFPQCSHIRILLGAKSKKKLVELKSS